MNGALAQRVAALCVALALAPRTARAGDAAAAEALFREGRERLGAHDVAGACVKFEESERLEPSPGTLLNLAACHETLGQLATAWAEFVSSSDLAVTRGDAVQAGEARRRAAALEPRVPRLTIVMDDSVPGVVVRRDDVELSSASLGTPLPVDPGAHRVVARAAGFVTVTLDVTLSESEAREVHVPGLVRERTPPPRPSLTPRVAPLSSPDGRDARLGWVIGGAGLALAATGGALFALAVSANHNAEQGCPYKKQWACTEPALAAGRERDTLSTFATISGSLGVAGVGVGLWLLLHPSAEQRAVPTHGGLRTPSIVPSVSAHGSVVFLRESFE